MKLCLPVRPSNLCRRSVKVLCKVVCPGPGLGGEDQGGRCRGGGDGEEGGECVLPPTISGIKFNVSCMYCTEAITVKPEILATQIVSVYNMPNLAPTFAVICSG